MIHWVHHDRNGRAKINLIGDQQHRFQSQPGFEEDVSRCWKKQLRSYPKIGAGACLESDVLEESFVVIRGELNDAVCWNVPLAFVQA